MLFEINHNKAQHIRVKPYLQFSFCLLPSHTHRALYFRHYILSIPHVQVQFSFFHFHFCVHLQPSIYHNDSPHFALVSCCVSSLRSAMEWDPILHATRSSSYINCLYFLFYECVLNPNIQRHTTLLSVAKARLRFKCNAKYERLWRMHNTQRRAQHFIMRCL